MKIIKMILFYLLLGSTLYVGIGFISPSDGRGFSIAPLCWAFFSMLFVGSDLWLHHKTSRLIALALIALACLMSVEYYWFCDEYRLTIHINSNEKIFLASEYEFHQYWFCHGLLAGYLLLVTGVSYLNIKKTRTMNWYVYWFMANSYPVKHIFGFLARSGRGIPLYFAILLTPTFALYSILFIGIDQLLGTRMYNEYYWVLGLVVAASHISLFCLNTKLSDRWEDTYRKCCTDRKNMISLAVSVVAVVVWIVLLVKWV